ncbi:MAG: energy-coupling factor ABC transporter ATP-binding protein [Deltaproteobacteria bacterium]|nr:energy-coupling factor ABC transporter ATP-binding protein [Deltaproteobacteria bacterium]
MEPAIVFQDLSFTYKGGDRPALDRLQATVPAGQWLAVMGEEGAGKSSLCLTLNGLIPRFFKGDYRGRVLVNGGEVSGRKVAEMSRTVGLVLQDFEAQLFSSSVELEMAFGPENHGRSALEIASRIRQYLALVGLTGKERREPASLSGGEKQRLALGSILAMEPEILVLDEPTTDLDPAGRREVYGLARSWRDRGHTLVLVDQDPEEVVEADRVWLLKEGKIMADGRPRDLFRDPALCRRAGLRPPALAELFQLLGWPGAPLTLEEAVTLIDRQGWLGRHRANPPLGGLPPSGPVLIRMDRVCFTYPGHSLAVLQGLDLEIRPGEFLAILGPNGSGKSTLARLLNGLLKPTGGQVLVGGKPTSAFRSPEMARQVGYVFQNPDHQLFARSVAEEVGFGPKIQGMAAGTVRKRVEEALEAVGLAGAGQLEPFALTRGERQRVAVASMLAAQPAVLVLDEPTTGLDYGHQRSLLEMLQRLNDRGHTIVVITHHLWVAAEFCRRCLVLRAGQVLEDGPTREVFRDETRLAAAALLVPPIVRLSNRLGTRGLTVSELKEELAAGAGG